MSNIEPYGSWPSSITARSVVQGVVGFAELSLDGDTAYWIENRPEEAGRATLVARSSDGSRRELTPAPCNVRSRVHEYGGGAYCVSAGRAFFVDAADQNVHEVSAAGGIRRLTNTPATERFADFRLDAGRNRLLTVLERHGDGEPVNALAAVDLATGSVRVLHDQHDFYAAPRLAPDGRRLAFLAWDHPNMPWDGSLLFTADIAADGGIENLTQVAGGAQESVTQPDWLSDGSLVYLSDLGGYYNLYQFGAAGTDCILADDADYAQPAWVFGQRDWCALGSGHLVATRLSSGGPELLVVDLRSGLATPVAGEEDPWRRIDSVTAGGGAVSFIAGFADRTPAIERLVIATGEISHLAEAGGPPLEPGMVSRARAQSYPTRDGSMAHAFFYPPANEHCSGPRNSAPPLVVMSHGGPTAATDAALNLRVQYYTSRGWAVLDVNYRGSSGFGRGYRTALNGRWGVLDVQDCEDGVRYLVSQGLVDPARIAIRGGSAGGFTTLAALTTTTTFRAGASHYGIGDLSALARDTHKFESRYLHTLLSGEADLTDRSPIHHLDGLSCPVIFFQGGEDRVVPPNQAQAMVDALVAKHIPVACLVFPEEGHGFRSAANIVRALECELAFFSRIFGITPADALEEPEIIGWNNQEARS